VAGGDGDWPPGLALDAAGSLFIADPGNNRVRKVNTNGIITTVAGGGGPSYLGNFFGDGGPATSAGLLTPSGLAFDSLGNLFIVDDNNERVRKVATNGIITTVVGNGTYNFSGDGGAATTAALWGPAGIAVGPAGELLIADGQNGRIRRVSSSGVINTVAGGGVADGGAATNAILRSPSGIAVFSGTLFIADSLNNRIRKVDTNGIITTIALLTNPNDVAVDSSGDVLVADSGDATRIHKIDSNGIITIVAGGGSSGYLGDGPAIGANLSGAVAINVDSNGNLLIADSGNNRIRKVDANGTITTVAGNGNTGYSGDGGSPMDAALNSPGGVAVDASGALFIADTGNQRIRKVAAISSPVFAMGDASAADAGAYDVIVIGPGGSVTSSIATLTVASTPLIYGPVFHPGGGLSLSLVSAPYSTNALLMATNLTLSVFWEPISTNVAAADGTWQYIETNSGSYPQRFFRTIMGWQP
jgi:sugar lactone lactonase YvrE